MVAADKVAGSKGGSVTEATIWKAQQGHDEREQLQKEHYLFLKATVCLASLSVMCCYESVKGQWCYGRGFHLQ